MTPATTRTLFFSAALFNWAVATALFFIPNTFLALFNCAPGVEQSLWVQQFSGLVFMFGIGYYWASKDLKSNVQIIKLGIIAKLGVTLIGILNVVTGDISWQFMIPVSADAIWAALFFVALKASHI